MADLKLCFLSFVCVVFLTNFNEVTCSKELLSKMSSGFTKVVDACKNELNVGEHIMQDMYNFWREEYALVNRDLGCMILCMVGKLDLVGEDMKMHHGKAQDFAKSHGADDEVAKQIVTLIHDCENQHQSIDDGCSKALEVAKCFRTKIHELNWAPSMEVVMEEIVVSA